MSDNIAIKVEDLSKCYPIFDKPRDRLKQMVLPRLLRLAGIRTGSYFHDFWALKNVSFEVRKGEAVGILGRNGAGKSTLLQIISGTLAPSSGSITVNGRVAALLELGSGFNPEFTGRENVFLSGAILGVSESEMKLRFEEVLAFAEIGEFIDQPVKTYSSGMMMRLAFAVNTCLSPDILIVDEALGVGDAPFQAKCFRRLRELIDGGVSLLFVSHDVGSVRSLCHRSLWLKKGQAEMWGEAKVVSKEYEKFCWREQGVAMEEGPLPESITAVATSGHQEETSMERPQDLIDEELPFAERTPPQLLFSAPALPKHGAGDRYGTQDVVIQRLLCTNSSGEPVIRFDFDEPLHIHYLLYANKSVDSDFMIGIRIKDSKDNYIYSAQDIRTLHRLKADKGSIFYAHTVLPLPLAHGQYLLKTGIFGFTDGSSRRFGYYDFNLAVLWDIVESCFSFEVAVHPEMPLAGPVHTHANLSLQKLKEP